METTQIYRSGEKKPILVKLVLVGKLGVGKSGTSVKFRANARFKVRVEVFNFLLALFNAQFYVMVLNCFSLPLLCMHVSLSSLLWLLTQPTSTVYIMCISSLVL